MPFTDNAIRKSPARRRLSIELDIAGASLMLRGRFSDWESGLALGPDLDTAGVRLFIDATSAREATAPVLVSFASRKVEAVGTGAYRAAGTLTGPRGAKPVDLLIETSVEHTALFVLSFVAEKGDFADGWRDLMENVVPFTGPDGASTRQAHAWLLPPVLAAA
jgi:hypothetical protein